MKLKMLLRLSLCTFAMLAMENAEEKKHHIEKVENLDQVKKIKLAESQEGFPFEQLPNELKLLILEKRVENAIWNYRKDVLRGIKSIQLRALSKDLKAFLCTSKSMHKWFHYPERIKAIISMIGKHCHFGDESIGSWYISESMKRIPEIRASITACAQKRDKLYQLLDAADEENYLDLKQLVEKNYDVDFQSSDFGQSALIILASKKPTTIEETQRIIDSISFLITNKANLNLQNDLGNTALHEAVLINSSLTVADSNIIKTLLKSDAQVNIKNYSGKTALDIAKEKNAIETIKQLEQHLKDHPENGVEKKS